MAAMARSMIPPAGVRFADGVESPAGNRNRGVSCGARRWKIGGLSSEFSDSQHTQYYVSSRARCGAKEKEMKKENKKKLKLLKRLSSDLQMFASDDAGGMIISEAQKVLLAELEKLRTAEMEKKRTKMEEKALMKSCRSSESSSSSSESSDSDCGNDVMVMKSRPKESVSVTRESRLMIGIEVEREEEEEEEEERNAIFTVVESNSTGASRKIEVCMGGKCKKQGAMALMEDFQRKVGEEAVVVTCKCMGQCKNAPNVRVSPASCVKDGYLGEKLLCIGVGLEDVDTIVADIMGASKSSPQQAAMATY